ncbi:putative bifunctional diguanylate cyclase/phosphodiesterase [Roseibium alexandrii]|uniref:Diguanylate cyclase (GGDEF) domain protein n=1 Tax=Roseibium alexandrii (strain DSM 17067 / NCIMB 14079 / DFL-11) TaxID=244592 RepID=A0A5E8GXW9_ROSAD|nr:EAL domain-containing protein [Roseibium alexandrii]EEE44451.1 diguanylate cyclase (GGDEF) domain protein [Roseibium alexandrii DFL-11]
MDISAALVGLVGNVAVLAAAAALTLPLQYKFRSLRGKVGLGILFGCLCLLVIKMPVEFASGAQFDTRAAPALMAGYIGGPISGLITMAIGAAARYSEGGTMALGGALSLVIYGSAGLAARALFKTLTWPLLSARALFALAAAGTIATLPAFFVDKGLAFGLAVLQQAGFMLVIGNMVGVPTLGLLIRVFQKSYEKSRRARDDAFITRLAMKAGRAGIWEYDPRTKTFTLDEIGAALMGADEARKGIAFDDLTAQLDQKDQKKLQSALQGACMSPTPFSVDLRTTDKLGLPVWLRFQGSCANPGDPDETKHLGILQDITSEVQTRQQIKKAAWTDHLTGLANRMVFDTLLEKNCTQDPRARPFNALLVLDVDNFKLINDNFGHAAGDAVLKRVAATLHEKAQPGDTPIRIGGDEFAFLCSCPTAQSLKQRAETIADAIAKPHQINGLYIPLDVSIGAIQITADQTSATETVLFADAALYAAKETQGTMVSVFDQDIEKKFVRRKRIENKLLQADFDTTFSLNYQPVVQMPEGRATGYEALLRWKCPDGTNVSPAEFIPIAESLGLIREIGAWVLKTAIKEALTWPGELRVAVNVSPHQIGTGHLASYVEMLLRESAFPAERLELEFTETVFMRSDHSTLEELARIRAMGIRLVLDDFGIGYSSLSYLDKFSFDKMKLDRSFVTDVTLNPTRAAIVASVVDLAARLDIDLVAEGVETLKDLHFLTGTGVKLGQGFYFARPMPAADLPLLKQPARNSAGS